MMVIYLLYSYSQIYHIDEPYNCLLFIKIFWIDMGIIYFNASVPIFISILYLYSHHNKCYNLSFFITSCVFSLYKYLQILFIFIYLHSYKIFSLYCPSSFTFSASMHIFLMTSYQITSVSHNVLQYLK
jgi:hypothetical protein